MFKPYVKSCFLFLSFWTSNLECVWFSLRPPAGRPVSNKANLALKKKQDKRIAVGSVDRQTGRENERLWRLHRRTISPTTKYFRQGWGDLKGPSEKIVRLLPHEAGYKRSQIASVERLVISGRRSWNEKWEAERSYQHCMLQPYPNASRVVFCFFRLYVCPVCC